MKGTPARFKDDISVWLSRQYLHPSRLKQKTKEAAQANVCTVLIHSTYPVVFLRGRKVGGTSVLNAFGGFCDDKMIRRKVCAAPDSWELAHKFISSDGALIDLPTTSFAHAWSCARLPACKRSLPARLVHAQPHLLPATPRGKVSVTCHSAVHWKAVLIEGLRMREHCSLHLQVVQPCFQRIDWWMRRRRPQDFNAKSWTHLYEQFFSFTVVRNPFAKAASGYDYLYRLHGVRLCSSVESWWMQPSSFTTIVPPDVGFQHYANASQHLADVTGCWTE